MSEDPEAEPGRKPPMTVREAYELILSGYDGKPLPEGYALGRRKKRQLQDGSYPSFIRWTKEGQDPPPQLPKSREITPMLENEYEEMKTILNNRTVIWVAQELAMAQTHDLADDMAKKLSDQKNMVFNQFAEIKRKIDDLHEKGPTTPKSSNDLSSTLASINNTLNAINNKLSGFNVEPESDFNFPEAGLNVNAERVIRTYNELIKKDINIEQVGRVITADPHVMLYYAFVRSEWGYEDDIPDFIRDIIVSYFASLSPPVRLGFLIGGKEMVAKVVRRETP